MNGLVIISLPSGGLPASIDRPDCLERVAAHDVIAVVEIDRRVAMRNDASELMAARELPALLGIDHPALLVAEEEIDGALVGGASLDPASFASIVNYGSS